MKAVIFDVDGTLIDSVDLHAKAWQEAFAKFGKNVSFEDAREQIGKGGNELLPVFLSDKEIHQFGKELKEFRGELFKEKFIGQVKAFPDVRALMLCIKEHGRKIALGSSSHQEELDFYIKLMNIEDLLDATTNADDADRAKPHPDIFAVTLKKLNVSAKEAIVVGDSPYDAIAAGKAGLPTIGFLSGGFAGETLTNAGAAVLYKGPSDLLENYKRSPI